MYKTNHFDDRASLVVSVARGRIDLALPDCGTAATASFKLSQAINRLFDVVKLYATEPLRFSVKISLRGQIVLIVGIIQPAFTDSRFQASHAQICLLSAYGTKLRSDVLTYLEMTTTPKIHRFLGGDNNGTTKLL